MSCDRFRDAISARIDDEASGVPDEVVDDHLSTCPSCRDFSDSTHRLRRRLGVREAVVAPDLSPGVVRAAADDDRRRIQPLIRVLLALVAVQIVIVAVPDFLADRPDSHSLRHLGAFSLAYAVGLLVVVARPARARTMLSVALVLVAALAATTAVDVLRGDVPLANEAIHLLELSSAVLLWVMARPDRVASSRAQVAPEDRRGPVLAPDAR